MPNFKKNPNPIKYGNKKSSGFKMKSPLPFLDFVEGDKITHKTKVRKKDKTKITGDKTFSLFSGNKFGE